MIDALALALPVLLLSLLLLKPVRAMRGRARTGASHLRRWTFVVALSLLLVGPFAWLLMKSPVLQLGGELVSRVETNQKLVALTFDDGPVPEAARSIGDVLRERDVRATFFLNGEAVQQHPDVVRELFEAGHELGNHSWSHPRMVFRPMSLLRKELDSTDDALRAAGYAGPVTFRAPYGKKLVALPWLLADAGRTHVTWDVAPDSNGAGRSADELVREVVDQVRPGSIVLLHVMYPSRVASREAVPRIVDELQAAGYRFVTVSELLAARDT